MIPSVDLSGALGASPGAEARSSAGEALRDACAGVGFVTVTGHGVPPELASRIERAAHAFFALPADAKRAASPRAWNPQSPNLYRGYFASSVHGKEGLDLGDPRIDPAMEELVALPFAEPNRLPAALDAGWHATAERWFAALAELSAALLRLLVEALGGDASAVGEVFRRPEALSTLRFNLYPEDGEPVARTPGGRGLAAPEHTDSAVLTVLHQDRKGGLQVRDRSGGWRDVPFRPGALVVNTGLALERMTAGALPATPHRVLHSAGRRLSIPFFLEPTPATEVGPRALGLPGGGGPAYEHHLREALERFPEYRR